MEVTDEQKRDLARRMLEIMETMEEALQYMQTQLDGLKLEAAKELFSDFAVAAGRLTELLPEFFMEERKEQLLKVLRELRGAITCMQKAFGGGELPQMQLVLAQVMAPAFTSWREEARQHLLTWAAV
ncbi:hypothetical protein [Anaeroarcus burkinensis]|uniref:hypothetical protein n=1 Tax=Anaeroarcus burkinensis TaxID=82376 RepID=UPI000403502D|nr:hypothetical protein [Anaeroarcus burkinensis]